ncbi:MAG TPA: hypothetical protein VFB14_26135 [Bryobacteraceae bacterium]|nr:hypothetical protein [Bryobacteraceae bacterium]
MFKAYDRELETTVALNILQRMDRMRCIASNRNFVRWWIPITPTFRLYDLFQHRETHLRIAKALAEIAFADAGVIAEHYAQGGDAKNAASYAIQGAAQAETVFAFDRAVRRYQIALKKGPLNRNPLIGSSAQARYPDLVILAPAC